MLLGADEDVGELNKKSLFDTLHMLIETIYFLELNFPMYVLKRCSISTVTILKAFQIAVCLE